MRMLGKHVAMTLATAGIAAMISMPATAKSLEASDMAFAFSGKAGTTGVNQPKIVVAPKAHKSVVTASVQAMTQAEMEGTKGARFQFLGSGGGGRICGVICGPYGFRMDYARNPSPTMLHFHAGRLSSGGSWGGHRPWNAPWKTY